MRKWRATAVAVLAAGIAVLLVSCGSRSSSSSANSSSSLKPVTYTYFSAGSQFQNVTTTNTEIGKILEKETGVTWKMSYPVGDVNTKIGTMIAGGQYPDVLVPDTAIDKVVQAGGFISLNKLINKYGPNVKKVYGRYFNEMEQSQGNTGNIYFLPFDPQVGKYIPDPNINQGAFWIQRRVLKAFNYPKVKTLATYMSLIKKYVAMHPNEGLIGFTCLDYDWRVMGIDNPPMHLDGFPNDGAVIVNMKTHQASVYGDKPVTRKWLKTLNTLNSEGLFDKSSFVNNYDQYLAEISSGKVLGFFDYGWEVNQAFQALQKRGKNGLLYMPLPVVFGKNIKDQYVDPPSFVNNRGIGITVSAKNPVRIMKFFNTLLEPKNQILCQWGIKGQTYEVAKNGRFYRTKKQIDLLKTVSEQNKIGFTYFDYAWPEYGAGSTLPGPAHNSYAAGRQPEVARMSYTAGDKLILKKYGVQTFSQLFAKPEKRPWYPAWSISLKQGSPAQIFAQKAQDLEKRWFPKLVLAKPSQFSALWNQYRAAYMKLDPKVYTTRMTQLVKQKIKEVTGSSAG